VLIKPEKRRPVGRYERARIAIKEVKLHRGMHTLTPVVQPGEPAQRAGVPRCKTNLLRERVDRGNVGIGVIEARLDRQPTVVTFLIPAAKIEASNRSQGRMLCEPPLQLQGGAVVADIFVNSVLRSIVEPADVAGVAGYRWIVVDGMRAIRRAA